MPRDDIRQGEREDQARSTAFDPAVPSDWSSLPAEVASALDELGAAATGDFVRRDGTTPLTADWDVGDFDVAGLAGLAIGKSSVGASILIDAQADGWAIFKALAYHATQYAIWQARRGRGTSGTPADVQANDVLGEFSFEGYVSGSFFNYGSIRSVVVQVFPSRGKLVFRPFGSTTVFELSEDLGSLDGVFDIINRSSPGNPASGTGRLYTKVSGNNIQLIFRSATGVECTICDISQTGAAGGSGELIGILGLTYP